MVATTPSYSHGPSAAADSEGLGAADEAQLWERWCAQRDEAARQALSALYLPYAKALAARCYARRVHNEFEFEEYLHFAVVGLMESLDRFTPGRGVQFTTFSTQRINGSMLSGIEHLSERAQQIALRRRLDRDRLDSLSTEPGADSGERLLQELGEIGIGIALGFILEGTGMMVGPQDVLPDNAYSGTELKQLHQQLWHLVDQLTPREAQVIRMHYLQQQSFEAIGDELALTKGRISQLHKHGLSRLRELIAGRSLNLAL